MKPLFLFSSSERFRHTTCLLLEQELYVLYMEDGRPCFTDATVGPGRYLTVGSANIKLVHGALSP